MNEEIDKEKFDELLEVYNELPFKEKKNPTFLEIIKQPARETAWSNILAFYFDPKREHGLGRLMLKSFFEALGEDVEIKNFDSIKVRTEVSTENRKRIDLVIEADNFVLGIENKVDHWLNNDLEEYSRKIDALINGRLPFKVVLSKFHCKPHSGFKNLTYEVLIRHIRENLPSFSTIANPEYLIFLKDFLRNIENAINFKEMIENNKILDFFKNYYPEIKKISKSFMEITREVNGKFQDIYNTIDFQDLERLYGDKVTFATEEPSFQNEETPTFYIIIRNNVVELRYVIYIKYDNDFFDIYCYIEEASIEIRNKTNGELDDFGLYAPITDRTQDISMKIQNRIKEIIEAAFIS